ncbi:MAG: M20/M25/M40 family metallo-hydrolase [Candidatus Omnitrophota bacterium]|nr:M20/M25/M40 family metallo-hydrolase [Candidatus Omnitrophota bacterium]
MKLSDKLIRLIFIGFLIYAAAEISAMGWDLFAPDTRPWPRDPGLAQRLNEHVRKLSEETGDRSISRYSRLEQAAGYIIGQLHSYGCDVRLQQYYAEGKRVENIIFRKTGSKAPGEFIVAGAHYDTYFGPGADDNASGVAGLLELARMLQKGDVDRSVELAFFVNEEEPFFKTENMGSRVFAREAKQAGKDIKAAIIFDMIGYYTNRINSQRYFPLSGFLLPHKGNFIAISANSQFRQLAERLQKSFRRGSASFPVKVLISDFDPSVNSSDHWSFWQEGYPAVMVSDTDFLRNTHYHTSSDTWETLDFSSMACVVEGFYQSILELARK